MSQGKTERFPFLRLAGLSLAALGIHGYHLGVEDAEIYIPAAKRLMRPELYPFAPEFFLSHGRLSIFSPLLALAAQLTRLPMDWVILLSYILSVFLILAASWQLVSICFASARSRWIAVSTLCAVLAMPAANTGLLLADPYLTARSLSTPLTLFALAAFLRRRPVVVTATTLLTGAVHPQMAAYLLFLFAVMWLARQRAPQVAEGAPALASVAMILPTGFQFSPATEPYREALFSRDYFFLSNWTWYHWLGLLGPLAILYCFTRFELRGTLEGFRKISFAMIPFGLVSIAVGAVLCVSPKMEMFVRLQPLRCFHLITLVFVLLLAGVAGEYLGARRWWIGAAGIAALAAGMFVAARQTYPFSPQVEIPGSTSPNAWVNTLLWIRNNTPVDAVFAVDSRYFKEDPVDVHGFRAISERSDLADYFKDGGVASLFPAIAPEWKTMSNATYGLNHFRTAEFQALRQQYPEVGWTVVHGAAPEGLECPYRQQGYAVCRIP